MIRTAAPVLLALAGALAPGCSAVLPGPPADVPCTLREDGTDPCLERGQVCVDGFCRGREVCNGLDDDGDGLVDEGVESDADGDGFTWCGSGVPALADCNDADPNVHPADPTRGIAAPEEICDGRDNQCDGEAVDYIDTPNCTPPQRCSRTEARCVDPICTYPEFQCAEGFQCRDSTCMPGDCTVTGCAAPQVCDRVTRLCVEPQPIGSACDTDAQCADQRCVPLREALGISMGLPSGAQRICTKACCSDIDCPAGFVCWAPGTGARGCVARTLLEMGPLGAPEPSERTCSDRVACQPGSCLPQRYGAYDRERTGFVCGTTSRHDEPACESHEECESGICLFGHEVLFLDWDGAHRVWTGPCTGACRTSADCARFQNAYNTFWERRPAYYEEIRMACLTGRFTDTTDFVAACFESSGSGAESQCTTDAECLERACIGGRCRATCCSDSDCPVGNICRPFARGDHWEMRCAPPLDVF